MVTIYALTDEEGTTRYVGRSSRPDARFKDHRKQRAWVVAYRVLELCTEENWRDREKYWIAFYRAIGLLENIAAGGQGHPHTPESKRKLSAALRGRKKTPEQVRRFVESRRLGAGWSHTEETRVKLSRAHKGKSLPPSHRANIALAHSTQALRERQRTRMLGTHPSESTRQKLRDRTAKRIASGSYHSPETIEKMRQARLLNPIRAWQGKKLPDSVRENMRKAWVIRKQRMKQ